MAKIDHVADLLLNYNPEKPQPRFKSARVKGALMPKVSDFAYPAQFLSPPEMHLDHSRPNQNLKYRDTSYGQFLFTK